MIASMDDDNNTMKALVIYDRPFRVGDVSQNIELADNNPIPSITKPTQILVKVDAASLQIEDLYTAIGRRPLLSITPTPTHPVTLGIEFTGTIVQIGETVLENGDLKIGDAVMGCMAPVRVRHGCWAQYVCVSSGNVTKVPDNWNREQAASFGMSALVAQIAINSVVNPSQQRIAIVGASGGIGSILTTLCASTGAHVVGVCSQENSDYVKSCGAREVCTRESGGLAYYRVSDEGRTDKLPLDYVLDCVGGDRVEQDAAKSLRKWGKGHFVTVVGPGEYSFGGSESTGGIGRGAAIAAKAARAKWGNGHTYTLASMKPFGIGTKLAFLAECINQYTIGKGPTVRTRVVAVNDMTRVREAMDAVARHRSGGRIILDFTVLNEGNE